MQYAALSGGPVCAVHAVCGALGSLELSAIGANATSGLLLGTAAFGLLVGGACCTNWHQ